jgi:hypothetical protein
MAITFNDNINVSAQKPVDSRFGPYANTGAALAAIPSGQRYIGLTVGIGTNPVVEYWFNDGIADGDLIAKTATGGVTSITQGTGISVSGSATNPTIAVTTPTQLTTNISTDVITDQASDVKYPSVKAVKTYADSVAAGLLDDRGSFSPSSTSPGAYPTTGGSGPAGAILKGDLWYIRSAGYLGTTAVAIGASVRALIDSPSPTTDADWDILDTGLGFIPENSANRVLSGSGITSDPNNDAKYPSVKALTEYLTTFTPSVPTLQQVVSSGVGANTVTGYQINVQNTLGDSLTYIQSGNIYISNTTSGGIIQLGTSNKIIVQVGTSYTTCEFDRITFNGPGYTNTLLSQSGNQTMYLPSAPSSFQTLALSVNGTFADTSGNITIPNSIGSGTPNRLTAWSSPLGTSLVDSAVTSIGSSVGIFNDTSKITAAKYAVHIGLPGSMDFPIETLTVSDQTGEAVFGIYNEGSTPGSDRSSIYLGNIQTSYSGECLFAESRFVNETSLINSTLSNNFVTRDSAVGTLVDSVENILTIHPDGAVSLNAAGSGVFTAASPRLVINEDVTVASPTYKLYVNGEVKFTGGGLEVDGINVSNLSGGLYNSLVVSDKLSGGLFNQPAGTLNKLVKWTNSTAPIGDSQVYDNGTYVGIGTVSPSEKLHVNGNIFVGETGAIDNDSYAIKLQGKGTTGISQTGEIKIDASGTAAIQGCLQLSTSGFMRFSSGSAEGYAFTGSPAILRNNTGGIRLQSNVGSGTAISLRNNSNQTSGNLLSVFGANTVSIEPLVIRWDGNVGINNSDPQRPLHINDVMRLQPRATDPSSGSAGDIYYNSAVNKLKIHNGTTWKTVQFEP